MSTPKPRVYWDALHQRWATQCDGCQLKGWETSWQRTVTMAVKHSRTHTAERIAEHLEREADKARKSLSRVFCPTFDHDFGYLGGTTGAVALIRKYLVGRTS